MSLAKAVEAARNSLRDLLIMIPKDRMKEPNFRTGQKALASLPEPKTEFDIIDLCRKATKDEVGLGRIQDMIQALKSAGVLLVRE